MMDETSFNLTTDPEQAGISVVRPDVTTQTRQQLPYFVGVSATTTGATGFP